MSAAQHGAVHQELHPGHPDIVGGGGGKGHRARHGRAVGGSGQAHRGCLGIPGRPDCWVCDAAAFTWAKVVVSGVAGGVMVIGADNCMVDVSARACWSP